MSHRGRKLERHTLIVHAATGTIAFYAVVVSRLFFETANLYIVETCRNSRHVCIDVTRVPGHLVVAGQCGIPVNLGFILAVGRVPHDFGRVRSQVTDLDILDIGITRGAHQRGKGKRRIGAIHKPLGRISFAADINRNHLEVVGSTVLESRQVNFMAHAIHRILGRNIKRTSFVGAIQNHCRATHILRNFHDGRIVTHIADFYVHLRRSAVTVFFADSHGARRNEHGRSVNTGFRKVVVFPTQGRRSPSVYTFYIRGYTAEQGARRRIVLIACTWHVLAFGVRGTVVRVSIVLITHAQQEGHIPRVHTKHVVELVYTQLFHGSRVPVLHTLLRKLYAFKILRDFRIGKNFKDVSGLVAVINPGLVSLHNVPEVTITQFERSFRIGVRQIDRVGTRTREVADVCSHGIKDSFRMEKAIRFGNTILGCCFLIAEQHLIKTIERVRIGVCPAGVLGRFRHAVTGRTHPATGELVGSRTRRFHHFRARNSVLQIRVIPGRGVCSIVQCPCSKSKVVMIFIVAVISSTRPASRLRIVHIL